MKRKIYKQLLRWKESKDRKPLMLLGARQVGKTWIMRHFGEHEYKKVAYVNCDDEPRIKQLFELDYDINRDRKSTRLNSSHVSESRMPSSA